MHKSAFLLLIGSIILSQQASEVWPSRDFNTDAEERLIYTTVINQLVKGEGRTLFLIDTTSDSNDTNELLGAYENHAEQYLSRSTLFDYRRRNLHPRELTEDLQLDFPYDMLKRDQFAEIFKEGCTGWWEFREKYPASSGVASVSRVGFNSTGTEALVYIAYGCGELCGKGGYLVLAKEGDEWRMKEWMMMWVS